MTILELREKRAKAWAAAKAFLDSHRNEKGILSAEDDAAYTRMEQCGCGIRFFDAALGRNLIHEGIDHRYRGVHPVSTMMIHNPATIAWGDAGDMEKAIAMLDAVKDSIINAYEIKSGLSRAKLSQSHHGGSP